jgi:hypothetical protein
MISEAHPSGLTWGDDFPVGTGCGCGAGVWPVPASPAGSGYRPWCGQPPLRTAFSMRSPSVGEVAGSGDEHLVEAFAAQAADPAFGDCVRPWRLGRGLNDADLGCLEHRVEGVGEFGVAVAVADEKSELLDAVAEVRQEVAGLLGDPTPRLGGR